MKEFKSENLQIEKRLTQATEMKNEISKILDEERDVYKDSKRLFEEEINTLKSNLTSKVYIFTCEFFRKMSFTALH